MDRPTTPAGPASLVLVTALVLLPTALAHTGTAPGSDGPRIEGEAYDDHSSDCDPDYDGEHTRVRERPNASGGAVGWLPHEGCDLVFGNVSLDADTTFARLGYRLQNCGYFSTGAYQVRYVVRTGEAVLAAANVTFDGDCGAEETALRTLGSPPADARTLRIGYDVTEGPGWVNGGIDFLETAGADGGSSRSLPAGPWMALAGLGAAALAARR